MPYMHMFTHMHACGGQIRMLRDKLTKLNELPFLAYLDKHILKRLFSRCDGPPGQATATAGHEKGHSFMKGGCFFSNISGMGNSLQHATVVGRNIFLLQERHTLSLHPHTLHTLTPSPFPPSPHSRTVWHVCRPASPTSGRPHRSSSRSATWVARGTSP